MAILQWDQAEQKFYQSGVSKVILFPNWNATSKRYTGGVAWNGVTSIEESPDGGEANDIWADNVKYGSMRAVENLKGSISAYQWPDALNALDGKLVIDGIAILGQQKRTKRFGLCYRTEIGTEGDPNAGYQLHFLYDMMISPSEKSYETTNDSPDATEFSWDFECLPQKQTVTFPQAYEKLIFGTDFLYEGPEGYNGWCYNRGTSASETNDLLIQENSRNDFFSIKRLLSVDEDAYLHFIPDNNTVMFYYYVTPFSKINDTYVACTENVVTDSYPSNWPNGASPYPIGGDVYRKIEVKSAVTTDDYSFLGVTVCGIGAHYPAQIDEQKVREHFEIVVPKDIPAQIYTCSSVVLDSRSTSTRKMNAISQTIYTLNRMPTLSELLG